MKSVFETSIGIEAHMIKNMLAMNEVVSEIFGEHLQGGVGDLQAMGFIRVMVADEDFPSAQKIVADWEASQPSISQMDEKKKGPGYGSVLLGFIVGAATIFVLMKTPITMDGVDYNNDGVLDEQWQYSGGLIRSTKLDQNRDGEFDAIWDYDLKGLMRSSSFDSDFDGRHELKCHYEMGNTLWCLGDYDHDGFSEYREDYRFGVLKSVSMFDPASKNLKKKQYYEAERLRRSELDLDGDGVLEKNYEYDDYEEIQ